MSLLWRPNNFLDICQCAFKEYLFSMPHVMKLVNIMYSRVIASGACADVSNFKHEFVKYF